MQVKKQQLELDMEQQTDSKLGKEAAGVCLRGSSAMLGSNRPGTSNRPQVINFYAEYIMRNAGLEEAQAGIKIAKRNINNLRYGDDTTLMAESEEELKSLSMKVKEEREKVGLTLNIQKTKIMASGPITSWEIDGETMETMSDFIFGGLQNHCRW